MLRKTKGGQDLAARYSTASMRPQRNAAENRAKDWFDVKDLISFNEAAA